jgi:hypothetical protein
MSRNLETGDPAGIANLHLRFRSILFGLRE